MSQSDRRVARNAAASALADVAGKVMTLAWTVVAARELAPADFGAFFYSMSLTILIAALANWGFDAVLVLDVSRNRELLSERFTQAVVWQTVIAVPALAMTAAVAWRFRPSDAARVAMVMVMAAIVLDIWSDTSRAAASSVQRHVVTARALVLQRTATAALIIGTLVTGHGVVGLAAAFLAGSLLGVVAHLRAVAGLGARLRPSAFRPPAAWDYARRTRTVGVTAVVLMALFRVDTIMIGAFKGDAEVGTYSATYRLLETVLFVAIALCSAVRPVMTASGDAATVARSFTAAVSASAVAYAPFAAVCLMEPGRILTALYGRAYAVDSTATLRWLAFAPMIWATAYIGSSALLARGKPRGMLVAAVTAVVVNIAANLVAIPALGGTGAAITTTASYAVQAAVILGYLRTVDVRLRLTRGLLAPLVATAVMLVVLWAVPLAIVAELVLAGAVYGATWLLVVRHADPNQLALLTGSLPGRRAAALR